jgi:hypothetical protein
MDARRERWFDGDAGPLVRPYTMTNGRTVQPRQLDVVTLVIAAESDYPRRDLQPEHLEILEFCATPQSIAEISAVLRLPLLVTKVLVGDLVSQTHLQILSRDLVTDFDAPDIALLQAVLNGIRNV